MFKDIETKTKCPWLVYICIKEIENVVLTN